MRTVPLEISATDYAKKCRYGSSCAQDIDGTWVPARPVNVGWNSIDAIITRFRLAWSVFTGESDAFTWK